MSMRKGLAAFLVLTACVAWFSRIDRVEAASTDGVVLLASQGVPALAGVIPKIESRTWETSDGGIQQIKNVTSGQLFGFNCQNLTATPVYVGDSAVTSATGLPHCTDTDACPDGAAWGYDARLTYMTWSGALHQPGTDGGVDGVRCNLGITP